MKTPESPTGGSAASAPSEAPSRHAVGAAGYGPDAGRPVAVSDLATTPSSQESIQVVHHPSERFYELLDGGTSVALLVYEQNPQQIGITHALVREDLRGRGLGTTLIASALDDLVASGVKVANYCDSVSRFLVRYPDYERRLVGDA